MLSAVIFNAQGDIDTIVHPDFPGQLDDPAYNQPGFIHVRVDRDAYNACLDHNDIRNLAIPNITGQDRVVLQIRANAIAAQIRAQVRSQDHYDVIAALLTPAQQNVYDNTGHLPPGLNIPVTPEPPIVIDKNAIDYRGPP